MCGRFARRLRDQSKARWQHEKSASMPSVMKACHPRICPLKSFARIMSARMSFHSCADGETAFGITLILAIASKQRSLAGACADMGRTASRILVGLMVRRGLVEPREGVGCWVSGAG